MKVKYKSERYKLGIFAKSDTLFNVRYLRHLSLNMRYCPPPVRIPLTVNQLIEWRSVTRGQSNLTKSASRGAHSPVRGHPRGSKFVPLNSWGRVSY